MEGVHWIEGEETEAPGIHLRGALSGTLVVDADSSGVTLPEWLQDRVLVRYSAFSNPERTRASVRDG